MCGILGAALNKIYTMKKILLIAVTNIIAISCYAQKSLFDEGKTSQYRADLLKSPSNGILKVNITRDYPNVVQVSLCDYRGSLPLACRENYNVTMTTSTGRVVKNTDYKQSSMGTISPDEFPVIIDAKVTGLKGEEKYPLEFKLRLNYSGYYYQVLLYDEWTGKKGLNK